MLTLIVGERSKSSCSLRAHLALAQVGIPFTDLVIWDSLAICEYLAETFPEAQLWPIERDARARAPAGPFLFGAFSIADAMYAPVATRFTTYAVPLDDVARAYVDAIEAMPAMREWRAACVRH